jgi:hypothetical protein
MDKSMCDEIMEAARFQFMVAGTKTFRTIDRTKLFELTVHNDGSMIIDHVNEVRPISFFKGGSLQDAFMIFDGDRETKYHVYRAKDTTDSVVFQRSNETFSRIDVESMIGHDGIITYTIECTLLKSEMFEAKLHVLCKNIIDLHRSKA